MIDVVDAVSVGARDLESPFRFIVSDVYRRAAGGVAVAGKALSGFVQVSVCVCVCVCVCVAFASSSTALYMLHI